MAFEDLGAALAEILPQRPVKSQFALHVSTASVKYPSPEARAFVSALVDAVKFSLDAKKKK